MARFASQAFNLKDLWLYASLLLSALQSHSDIHQIYCSDTATNYMKVYNSLIFFFLPENLLSPC